MNQLAVSSEKLTTKNQLLTTGQGSASLKGPQLTPAEVSSYIWDQLLEQLSQKYNSEIEKIREKYSSDPEAMNNAILELQGRYTQIVQQLQQDYTDARVAQSPDELQKILNDAESAVQSLGQPSSPEQQKASEIHSQASQQYGEFKNQLNNLLQQLHQTQNGINQDQQLIDKLHKELEEYKKTNPEKASELQKQLEGIQNNLSALEAQQGEIQGYINSLEQNLSQLESINSEINALFDQVMNGDNPTANLEKLQKALQNLVSLGSQPSFAQIEQRVQSFSTLSNEIFNALRSIEESMGIDPQPWAQNGQDCYFDMGSFPAWNFMNWNTVPATIDHEKLSNYLTSLFKEMKEAGIKQIDLSFAQISDIDKLLNGGEGAEPSDAIATLMREYPGMLKEFIEIAHENGIKIDLSFGGENASGMGICGPGETPEGQAQKLIDLMDQYGIDAVDFDLEDSGAVAFSTANDPKVAEQFFKSLKEGLAAEGKTSTLTIQGSINNWPKGYLHDLFYDSNEKSIFNDLFDGLNLMLYGNNSFYISPNGGWGIEDWLDIIGADNAGKLHVGFQDAVDYEDLEKTWVAEFPGEECPWSVEPGSSPGSAAAQIFNELQERLKADGYDTALGDPFWWPDRSGGESKDRYAPDQNGMAHFGLRAEKDFWKKLQQLQGNEPTRAVRVKSRYAKALARV